MWNWQRTTSWLPPCMVSGEQQEELRQAFAGTALTDGAEQWSEGGDRLDCGPTWSLGRHATPLELSAAAQTHSTTAAATACAGRLDAASHHVATAAGDRHLPARADRAVWATDEYRINLTVAAAHLGTKWAATDSCGPPPPRVAVSGGLRAPPSGRMIFHLVTTGSISLLEVELAEFARPARWARAPASKSSWTASAGIPASGCGSPTSSIRCFSRSACRSCSPPDISCRS